MSSETDQPRQRTVAELLAEHGDGGAASGRRRRRRAETADEVDHSSFVNGGGPAAEAGGPEMEVGGYAPEMTQVVGRAAPEPPALDRGGPAQASPYRGGPGLGRPSGPDPRGARGPDPRGPDPRGPDSRGPDFRVADPRAPGPPAPDRQGPGPGGRGTGQWPAVEDPPRPGAAPPAGRRASVERPTEQIPRLRDDQTALFSKRPPAPESPTTVTGGRRRRGADASPADATTVARIPGDGGPPTQASAPFDPFELDSDDFDDDRPAGHSGDDLDEPDRHRSRPAARPSSTGTAWLAVVAQWVLGAVGGAALWVGFRYLWQFLPVVAIAAALVVTVGLVLVVRHLLRNNDSRTTVFAVLVGLLLTVSPAVLVFLHR